MGSEKATAGNSRRGTTGDHHLVGAIAFVKGLLALLFLLLLGSIIYASFQVSMFEAFPGRNIWVQVTLVDLYIGFIMMGVWVIYRERRLVVSIPWIVSFMLLGNLTVFAYVLYALWPAKSATDLDRFFHGYRANNFKSTKRSLKR